MALAGFKTIYGTGSGGKQYKSVDVPDSVQFSQYQVPGHNLNTWAAKDQAGQGWYLTDSGNWRNQQTKALSPTMPTWATAATTPTPAATTPTPGPSTAPTPTTPESSYKSIWDFVRNDAPLYQGSNPVQPLRSYQEFLPANWSETPTYKYAVDQGNKQLSRSLSAKGLLGSGVEDEARMDIAARAGADEVGRQMDIANQNYAAQNNERNSIRNLLSGMYQADFSQYQNNLNQERNREQVQDRIGLDSTGMALDFLQSLNPMQYAYPAGQAEAESQIALGKMLSQLAAPTGGGGGGGGGGGSRSVTPLPQNAGSNLNSTNYWINAAANILPGLVNAFTSRR